jgi:hypothetical protein
MWHQQHASKIRQLQLQQWRESHLLWNFAVNHGNMLSIAAA